MGGIRKVLREVGAEFQEGISEAKKFVSKRGRIPRQMGDRPPLAFAVVPTQFVQAPRRVARPRRGRIKRRR